MKIRPIFLLIFLTTLSTLFSVFRQGNHTGLIDHSLQVPYVKALNNTELYPNDLLISVMKKQYFVFMWRGIAYLARSLPLDFILISGHFISRFLLYLSLIYLAWILFQKHEVLYLVLGLFLYRLPSLGGHMMPAQFVHSGLVVSFLLTSVSLFLLNRYLASFLVLALSFYIHPLYAGYIAFAYLLYFLSKRERFLSQNFFLFCFSVLLTLPIFLAGRQVGSAVGADQAWINISLIRSPHHLAPFSWTISTWLKFTALVLFWFFLIPY